MINLIMFIISTVGLTNILVHGRILDLIKIKNRSVRKWMYHWDWSESLFSCYECTGFWAGLICGFGLFWGQWWLMIFAPFAGSVISQTYTDWIYSLRSNIDFEVGDDNGTK